MEERSVQACEYLWARGEGRKLESKDLQQTAQTVRIFHDSVHLESQNAHEIQCIKWGRTRGNGDEPATPLISAFQLHSASCSRDERCVCCMSVSGVRCER